MYAHRYKPYNSDSDSEADASSTSESASHTGSDTDSTSSSEVLEGFQGPDFKVLADNLAKPKAEDLSGGLINATVNAPVNGGYEIQESGIIKPPVSALPKQDEIIKPTTKSVTNVIMLDSVDRDTKAYPQPTNVTLRLPRTYKNVTGFSILQIKLLSAFYYFSVIKQNIDISILEIGRYMVNAGQTVDNIIVNTLREGTYDINGLMTEITTQLNRTPIFYDFINGFQDFATKFSVTGDFSLNFNYPGDTYYDSLLNQFIPNPSVGLIVSKYFVSQYAGLTSYTLDQIKIAYYYPVLKEISLDPVDVAKVNYNAVNSAAYLLPTETVYSRIVYTFQGIFDPVILEVINLNIDLLTSYRLLHTFRYTLVNKYVVTYQTQSNQIVISSPSLNTSLVNLLNYKSSQYFAEQLSAYGITQETYNSLNSQTTILLAVLNDMVNFYQQNLAVYFGINYNTYTRDYLLNPNYSIAIRDGTNAIGITSNFTASNTVPAISCNVLTEFQVDAPKYWKNMINLSSTIGYMNPSLPSDSGNFSTFNYSTWNNDMDAQDSLNPAVLSNVLDSNNPNTTPIGNLYINRRTQYSDVIIPIKSSKYTTFRFKSPVRQTLRVETLPRPTKYRYPLYNTANYDLSHVNLFDMSYCFVPPIKQVDLSSNAFNPTQIGYIPGFSTLGSVEPFGSSYQTSTGYWGSNYITLSVIDTRSYNTFFTPPPPDYASVEAPAYTYPFRVSFAHPIQGQGFTTPVNCFLYQDRSAFMADISTNGNEVPTNYSYYVSTMAGYSTINLDFKAYANKQYYILLRPVNPSFPTETLRIVPWFPSSMYYNALTSSIVGFDPLADPTSNLNNYNYATVADPSYINLPTASTLYAPPALDVTFSPLSFSTSLMGYDSNGVSTDLTNYIGFLSNTPGSNSVPNAVIHTDPTNGYIFQYKTPYNTSTAQYIYPGTSNSILYPAGGAVYTETTIPYRQKSIVNWFGNVFIPPSKNQFDIPEASVASIAPYTQSYPVNTGINGYSYYTRTNVDGTDYLGSSNLINLGDGVMGIGFLPEQGVWDIDQFMFKTVYTTTNDPNLNIQYLGIYPAVITSNRVLQSIQLSNACAVLKFASSITYNESYQNFGFDVGGGTYYEFKRDNSFITGSNSYLYGYTQGAYEYNFDINMYYVAIPFSGSSNMLYYYGLVGSAVPYPFYTPTAAVDSVASYEGPIVPPTGAQIVLPNGKYLGANPIYGPPSGYSVTQGKYEQSMTTVTNLIMYASPYPIVATSNVFNYASSLSYEPTEIIADCAGYLLTYDSIFRVYKYPTNTSSLLITEVQELTIDQIYPSASNIQYLCVAANETSYAFFGLSNSYLYIRTLTPSTGNIETVQTELCPLSLQSNVELYRATYNNIGGYTLSARVHDSNTGMTYLEVASKGSYSVSTFVTFVTSDSNVSNFIVQQSPKELYGRFWVFPERGSEIQDFVQVNPNSIVSSSTAIYTASVYPYFGSSNVSYAEISHYDLQSQSPSTFFSPIVTRDVEQDRIFFLSASGPTNFYESPTDSATPTIIVSQYAFPSTPSKLVAGFNGSIWGNIYETIFGNRHVPLDAPKRALQAWQIFNPVQRIVFHQIAKNFSFLLDLSGRKYPEYPHTALAVYDSSGNFAKDTQGKWGLESASNFLTADFNYTGYYFNAYDYIVPLQDNKASDDYYYLSVRNVYPTEQSQVDLRISAPNKYTYGYVKPTDLSGEISTIINHISTNDTLYSRYWDREYTNSLLGFNSNFVIGSSGKTFGGGVISGYPGSNISSVSGFGDFYSRIQSVFSTYSTLSVLASTINANVTKNVNNFILTEMKYTIPPSAQNRQRSTDPIRFSIKWKSALAPSYLALENGWGLGWNLGFAKEDTPFATVQIAPSFFKLIDDFIRLRLNPEFDLNRMDTTSKENLSQSLESTGETKTYHAKLLLANFGSYAQTLISNPIAFLNPLGKLDKLTFQWLDATNTILNNGDCDWNVVVQITEEIDIATPVK